MLPTVQNRLRKALNLPLEVTEEVPEAPLCAGCGAYVDRCTCGLYPPDGWQEDELLPTICATHEAFHIPTLAERLAESRPKPHEAVVRGNL